MPLPWTSGEFTLTLSGPGVFFEDDGDTTNGLETMLLAGDKFALVNTNLVTVDNKAPRLESGGVTTGVTYNSSKKMSVRGLDAKANSIQIKFDDDGKFGPDRVDGSGNPDPDNAGSGLNASSVTPGAFTVSGNSVSSVLVVGDDVYLTLAENLGPTETPSINIASAAITDKAGNAFPGTRVSKARDGLGPNLSLSKSGDLSDESVTITISTDEQLSSLPDVTLGRVVNADGGVVNRGDMECVYAAVAVDMGPSSGDPCPAGRYRLRRMRGHSPG